MLYSGPDDLLRNNRAHWLGMVQRRAKCLCVMDPDSTRHASFRGVITELEGQGLRPDQITFIDSGGFLRNGKLSLSLLFSRLEQERREAADQGYEVCDISVDMVGLQVDLSCLRPFLKDITSKFQEKQHSPVLLQFPQEGLPLDAFNTLLRVCIFVVLEGRIRHNFCRLHWSGVSAESQGVGELLQGIEQWNSVFDQNAALFVLLEQHGPAFCVIDGQDEMIHWNSAFAALTGLEIGGNGTRFPLTSVVRFHGDISTASMFPDQQGGTASGEIVALSGATMPVSLTVLHIPGALGSDTLVRLLVVQERRLKPCEPDASGQVHDHYQRIFELSGRGLAKIAADGRIFFVNKALADILGSSPEAVTQAQGMTWWQENCLAPIQYLDLFREIREHGAVDRFELEVRSGQGEPRQLLLDAYTVENQAECDYAFIAVFEDITERKKMERQLLHQAFHDQLTGLPNKALFMDRIEMALQQLKRSHDALFALAFLDIDNFKHINDTFGHVAGDTLLVEVARKIMKCVREVDTVSRFGGDEFVILLEDILDEKEAMHILHRIQEELADPTLINDQHEFVCTVSTGLVLSSGYASSSEMLRDADLAMYNAKIQKKGSIHLQRFSNQPLSNGRDDLRHDLPGAMDRGEFCLHYQPIFQVSSKRINGFEALIRWEHPRRGLLYPADFVSLVEQDGQIIPLTRLVLHKACARMHSWQNRHAGHPLLSICVNLSMKRITFPGIMHCIESALEVSSLDERSLVLDFPSKDMTHFQNTGELLLRLKEQDVQLSIDDVGTGQSLFRQLGGFSLLPVDNVKLERSVITSLSEHSTSKDIVWTTITLAHGLGIEVTAKGVETPDQLKLLAEMGCDYAQGYLFSRPMADETADEFLACCIQDQARERDLQDRRPAFSRDARPLSRGEYFMAGRAAKGQ
ncbi:PAS domain S-box-containing protein/diguanylate cyclase (GGDEF) domain-containing protein [Desulfonatronum zhilinae]|nr:PAS domain S-box-containing protein/diguanylate cyclase (GGDEF) domain-containing protein [Desulfonatronum zhilinae]